MPAIALTHLQEQIEAVRREAFAEGYAAAMHAIGEFAARAAADEPAASPVIQAKAAPSRAAVPKPTGRPRRAAKPDAKPAAKPASKAEPPQPRAQRGRRPAAAAQRPQRGTNARLIEEVLQAIAPRPARPTEIRDVLRRAKGVTMAFTSIRHALGQLEARHAVEQVANSKMWRSLVPEGGKGSAGDAAEPSA